MIERIIVVEWMEIFGSNSHQLCYSEKIWSI